LLLVTTNVPADYSTGIKFFLDGKLSKAANPNYYMQEEEESNLDWDISDNEGAYPMESPSPVATQNNGDGSLLNAANMEFPDRESLIIFVKKNLREKGYFISIKKSRQGKVWLKCDLGGSYRARGGGQRHSASRLIGCPFEITARQFKKNSVWKVISINGEHNHEPASIATGHSMARSLQAEEKRRVRELAENGVRVAETLNILKSEFGNTLTTAREIHNEVHKARMEELNGRSPIMALYQSLQKEDFNYAAHINANGALERLIFIHNDSIKMCQRWSTVFIMDCTYKTNKFGMPLLNIVGITATYNSFSAGFAFLCEEIEETYSWALQKYKDITKVFPKVIVTDRELALMNSIEKVYPSTQNLLCIWHINKNIVAKCKPLVSASLWDSFVLDWNACVSSHTIYSFEENWASFHFKYSSEQPALNYITHTWLPWKERFVKCFTGKNPHFGTTSSSRGEGSHFVLKRFLNISQLDMLSVYKKIKLMLANQFVELSKHIENDKLKVYHRHSTSIFCQIVKRVSKFALDKIWDQVKLLNSEKDVGDCLGSFTNIYGLPCKHTLRKHLESGTPIPLDSIHPQWHLKIENPLCPQDCFKDKQFSPRTGVVNRIKGYIETLADSQIPTFLSVWEKVSENPVQQVANPIIVAKKRGRPAGALNKVTKKRDKSAFEFVEGRKCRKCGQVGHNSATCGKNKE